MYSVEEIVKEEELTEVFGNANFGQGVTKREVVSNSLLKCATGYKTGHTAKCILEELGLVTKNWTLTKKGKEYLFAAYSGGKSI